MKKVMILIFALMMVVSVKAAQVSWSGYGYINNDPVNGYVDGGQAYLLLVTDPGTFAVTDVGNTLQVTGATIVDSSGIFAGAANGFLNNAQSAPANLANGVNYNFAVVFTTAGTAGLTLPTTGDYAVSPYGLMDAPFNTNSGGNWSMPGDDLNVDLPISEVPEPASMALFGLGVGVLALRRRFKGKKAA